MRRCTELVESTAFGMLLRDAIEIGNVYFDTGIDTDLDIANSPALNLTPEQMAVLETQYRGERRYYFRDQPAFNEITNTIIEIRDRLRKARRS